MSIPLPSISVKYCCLGKDERQLSWFIEDPEIFESMFIPDNITEGEKENRVLPWVFHNDQDFKMMQLECIMRGYSNDNVSWSHPGFNDSQVDTSTPVVIGDDQGVPYAIWAIKINTSAADAGIKGAICELQQQGNISLSIVFKIIMLRNVSGPGDQNVLIYDLGGEVLDEEDVTKEVEDDIKRQISEHFSMPASSVTRSNDGQKFIITLIEDKTRIGLRRFPYLTKKPPLVKNTRIHQTTSNTTTTFIFRPHLRSSRRAGRSLSETHKF